MTDEEAIQDDVQFLTGSHHRAAILDVVCDEPLRPTDVCDRVAVTRTTVQRVLSGFVDRQWVQKRDGRYRATVTGYRVNGQYQTLRTVVGRADTLAPLAGHLDEIGDDLPAAAFESGTVTAASDQNPLAAVDRVVEWFTERREAHLRVVTPIVARTFNETVAGLLEGELSIDIVIDEDVLERSAAEFETALERSKIHESVSTFVHDEPLSAGLLIGPDSGALVAYDETNNVRGLVESADEEFRTWLADRFERIKSRSRPLAAVLSETDL